MSAPIVVAEIERYLSEKQDFITKLIRGGTHSLIISNTGSGKTHMALNIARENRYTILLSPTRVIVDQMIATAKETDIKVLREEELGEWAYGEFDLGNQSKIWIGTFAALKKAQPDWSLCDYIFIDEIHFLLDLSLFGKETALEVWELTQTIENYPDTKLVSLTASDELVLPLQGFFKFDKIFMVKSETWRLRPNTIKIYPSATGLNNIHYILHYAKNYVKDGEKILCVVKSYAELRQLRSVISYLPPEVEIANAQDKKDSETYWEICFNSRYPKMVRVFITTTWISLGASILDPDVKHVICTFPNYSIVHQSLSRIRTGEVNVVIMQLPSIGGQEQLEIEFSEVASQVAPYAKSPTKYPEYFTSYKGKWIFFPLPQISLLYQRQQEWLFSDLYYLQATLENNLDCKVDIEWEELLPYRKNILTRKEFIELRQFALSIKFPMTGEKAFKEALQLTILD